MRAVKNQQRQLAPSPTADAYSNIDNSVTTQTTRTAHAINTEFSAAANSRKAAIVVLFTLNTKLSNSCTRNNSRIDALRHFTINIKLQAKIQQFN